MPKKIDNPATLTIRTSNIRDYDHVLVEQRGEYIKVPIVNFQQRTGNNLYSSLSDNRIAVWNDGNTEFNDSLLSDDGNNITLNSGTVRVPDGSGGAPSITFSSDADLGIFRQGADTLGVSTNGSESFRVDTSGISLDSGTTVIGSTEINLLDGMTGKTGSDVNFATGTAGTNGNVPQWNSDGDIVDTSVSSSNIVQDDDTDASIYDWVLDEDDMVSNDDTSVPTQQSVRQYVESNLEGLKVKDSVRAATDGTNIDLTSATDPNPIDGVTLSNGDRVLLKDQTTGSENGIYIANTATDPTTWTRAVDFDEDEDVFGGVATFVNEGTTNADTRWVVTTDDPIAVGTTSVTFGKFSGTGQVTGGVMVTKSGDTLDFDIASGSSSVTASSDLIPFADSSNSNAVRYDTVSDILSVYDSQTATLTNKTIDASNNTLSNLTHGSEVDNPASGVHGVTGDVVGTTDTQDLSNKTFTNATDFDTGANTIATVDEGGIDRSSSNAETFTIQNSGTGSMELQVSDTISLDGGSTSIGSTELNLLNGMTAVSGADATFISGTAGTGGNVVEWNADGDVVDTGIASSDVVTPTSTDTLSNKTLSSPAFSASSLTLNQTTANYTVSWNDPSSARTLTIPDPGINDTFAFIDASQTLTSKTLVSPDVVDTINMDDSGSTVTVSTGTTNGTQIGTSSSQLLGFFGATPITQPSSTGTTTGFTQGSGTSVNDDSTFTGNNGSTAYTIGDLVNHLKSEGLIAT